MPYVSRNVRQQLLSVRRMYVFFVFLIIFFVSFHQPVAAAVLSRTQARQELGLANEHFTEKDLKAAFRKRSLETHPDKAGGSNEQFIRVSEAYQVLSQTTNSSSDDTTARATANDFFHGNDEERLRQAEDIFFEMFGDLFDDHKVSDTIDNFFRDAPPSFWLRLGKQIVKWIVPKVLTMLESDYSTIQINGVTMTGKEFREMRKARMNRFKLKAKQQAIHPVNEDL